MYCQFQIPLSRDLGEGIVVFGGGSPNSSFGGAQVFTASEGSLSLNNSGNTISLLDTLDTVIDSVTYGSGIKTTDTPLFKV